MRDDRKNRKGRKKMCSGVVFLYEIAMMIMMMMVDVGDNSEWSELGRSFHPFRPWRPFIHYSDRTLKHFQVRYLGTGYLSPYVLFGIAQSTCGVLAAEHRPLCFVCAALRQKRPRPAMHKNSSQRSVLLDRDEVNW